MHPKLKAINHATIAKEGLAEWNDALVGKEAEDLPRLLPGLFVVMNDILLAIHYDLQALIEK
jgi:hypothetical protein